MAGRAERLLFVVKKHGTKAYDAALAAAKKALPDGSVSDWADAAERVLNEAISSKPKVKNVSVTRAPKGVKPPKAAAPAIIKNASGSQKRSSSSFAIDRDKLKREYPAPDTPTPQVNEKGKIFTPKATSAEETAVAKARAKIRNDMKEGYTPYFDVNARKHVDPTNYQMTGDTLTDALPARADTHASYVERANAGDTENLLLSAYNAAKDDPLAHDWYAMEQLERAFIDELGPEAGRNAFRKRFAEGMAATTGGADPTANYLMTAYGNFMNQKGLPVPTATYLVPHPIGGQYAGRNLEQFNRFISDNNPLTAKGNPKRFNFAGDFLGHLNKTTIDEQMSGLFQDLLDRKLGAPPTVGYGAYEQVINDLSKKHGIVPANFQEVAWAGKKNVGGKPMISHINDAIERTSRLTGASPDEVLREGIIHSTMPVFANGGNVALRDLAGKYEDQ